METGSPHFGDRRKFARVNIHAITRYFCPLKGNTVDIQTRVSNLSEGGVLMVTFKEQLVFGTPIHMSFVVPSARGHFMTVAGKIKHTEPLEKDVYQSGVEFVGLEEKDRAAIRECVASHPKT